MNEPQAENPLQRIKDEIRADADIARRRAESMPTAAPAHAVVATSADNASARRAVRIEELSRFHSAEFVERAFGVLLGRSPDADTLNAQLALLSAGHGKIEILGNLRWSPEGRARAVDVPGLLPRYVLVKLGRLPVIGYLVQSVIALASLPAIARYQRASDFFHFARVEAVEQHLRDLVSRVETLGEANEQLHRENEALAAELRDTRARFGSMQASIDAKSAIVEDSRQRVLGMNHWLASLRRNLATLELAEAGQNHAADAFNAEIARRVIDDDPGSAARLDGWADRFAGSLPAHAQVLDLDSGGDWVGRLVARGLRASGVSAVGEIDAEADVALRVVARADIAEMLARTAEDSLHGLTALDAASLLGRMPMPMLLEAIKRVLHAQGLLMIGSAEGPATFAARLAGRPVASVDSVLLAASLRAAGFIDIENIAQEGAACLIARLPERTG